MRIPMNPRSIVERATVLAVLALIASCLAAPMAFADGVSWHVRPDGSDTLCDGLTNAMDPGAGTAPRPCAFRSPQKGVDSAEAGDTVLLHAGTYTAAGTTVQGVTTILGMSRRDEFTSEITRLTVKAAGDGPVTFDGDDSLHTGIVIWGTSFATFDGIRMRGFTAQASSSFDWGASAVLVGSPGPDDPSSFLRFTSLDVAGATPHTSGAFADIAIWCRDCTNNEIRTSRIESAETTAIALGHDAALSLPGSGLVSDNEIVHKRDDEPWTALFARRTNGWVFRLNYVAEDTSDPNPDTAGVRVEDSSGWAIAENVFYHLPFAATHVIDTPSDGNNIETHSVINNTVDCADLTNVKGLLFEGCSLCQIRNNIAVDCHRAIEIQGDNSGTEIGPNGFFGNQSNLFDGGFGEILEGGDITSDPRFRKELPRPDPFYRLKPDSPALDAGNNDHCASTPPDGSCDLGAFQTEEIDNHPPGRPLLAVESITGVSAKLRGSAFSDADGDRHASSRWQVDEVGDDFSSPAVDSGKTTDDLTNFKAKNLVPVTAYVARVRYEDSAGTASDWSLPVVFSTLIATAVPPKVVSVNPANQATGVAADAVVVLVFDTPVDPASVTPSSVRLIQDGQALPQAGGSPSVSGDGLTVTVDAAGLFISDSKVKVAVTGGDSGIRSRDGAIPGKDFSASFKVGPAVSSTNPPDGATEVSTGVTPSITFLWPVNAGTVNADTISLKDTSSGKKVTPLALIVSGDGMTVTVIPPAELTASHGFSLKVKSGKNGLLFEDGRPLGKEVQVKFRTGGGAGASASAPARSDEAGASAQAAGRGAERRRGPGA